MMWVLATEDGLYDDFANGKGLKDFTEWAKNQTAPAMQRFLERGWTDNLTGLRTELAFARTDDKDVQASLDTLRGAAKKAQDILILSDGETPDDNNEEE